MMTINQELFMIRIALITLTLSTSAMAEAMTKIIVELSPAGSFEGVEDLVKVEVSYPFKQQ